MKDQYGKEIPIKEYRNVDEKNIGFGTNAKREYVQQNGLTGTIKNKLKFKKKYIVKL